MTSVTPLTYDLELTRGKTFSVPLRYGAPPFIYKAITGIANTAPIRLTVTSHGMPDGWRFAVSGVVGLTALNATADPPRVREYYVGTVVDADTIDINTINGTLLTAYTSGGMIQYYTPVALAGMTARITIRDKYGGTVVWTGTSAAGDLAISTGLSQVTLTIGADITADLPRRAVYDLELVTAGTPDIVTLLMQGRVLADLEVSTGDV